MKYNKSNITQEFMRNRNGEDRELITCLFQLMMNTSDINELANDSRIANSKASIFDDFPYQEDKVFNYFEIIGNKFIIEDYFTKVKNSIEIPKDATHIAFRTHSKESDDSELISPIAIRIEKNKSGFLDVYYFVDSKDFLFSTVISEDHINTDFIIGISNINEFHRVDEIGKIPFVKRLLSKTHSSYGNIYELLNLYQDDIACLLESMPEYDEIIKVFEKGSFFTIKKSNHHFKDCELGIDEYLSNDKYNLENISKMVYLDYFDGKDKLAFNTVYKHIDSLFSKALKDSKEFKSMYNEILRDLKDV